MARETMHYDILKNLLNEAGKTIRVGCERRCDAVYHADRHLLDEMEHEAFEGQLLSVESVQGDIAVERKSSTEAWPESCQITIPCIEFKL
jgi:hypothetical protein